MFNEQTKSLETEQFAEVGIRFETYATQCHT